MSADAFEAFEEVRDGEWWWWCWWRRRGVVVGCDVLSEESGF